MPEKSGKVEFVISRTYEAPRELVWKAWTEAERLAKWWGPKGIDLKIAKLELKPGGVFHYAMTFPDKSEIWARFTYREITPPEKLVFINAFADAEGNIAGNPWLPVWPAEILNSVVFIEQAGKTTFTLTATPLNARVEEVKAFEGLRESMQTGWGGSLSKLEEHLAEAQR